ncbi:MAG TPA: hypothetical protein VN920_17240, partial [Pyrinomonadaceae bacterium]|nr:hypothetical protein [Pyrinomonadaceae bacterium]
KDWVITTIIKAAVIKLATMFNPVGAIIQAILGIYHTVIFFIERINQILDFVQAIIDSIVNIAKGNISAAADWIEKALARAIPLIIAFLAALLGLGGISNKIKGIVHKIQGTVDKAMDLVIAKIVAGFRKLFGTDKKKTEPAGDVRAQARAALAEQLTANHTRSEAQSIIRQVAQQFKPEGLKSLELAEEDEDGKSAIIAEASPKLPLAHLLKDGPPKPRGRSVTTVIQLTLAVPVDHPATMLTPAEERKATVPTGGAVWTPSTKSSTKLNILTWNTSNINTADNDSHAEHRFVLWLTEEHPELMEHIEGVMINNIRRSPCSICGPELATLLRKIKKARKGSAVNAKMYWLVLHSSAATPTSWETLNIMEGAGWTLHAPGTAMPPEGNPHDVRVHLI